MSQETPAAPWHLSAITAADDSNYEVRIADQAANGKTYTFTAETVDVAGTPLPLVRCVEFDTDTLYDRAFAKAVFDAVMSFHHAHQQPGTIRTTDADGPS